jgi:hypothetical protein
MRTKTGAKKGTGTGTRKQWAAFGPAIKKKLPCPSAMKTHTQTDGYSAADTDTIYDH